MKSAVLVALALLGCKDKGSKETGTSPAPGAPAATAPTAVPAPSPAGDPSLGYCEHKAEGAVNGTGRSPGGFGALGSSYFHKDKYAELFILNCKGFMHFSFMSGRDMKETDFPMAPGKYDIDSNDTHKLGFLGGDADKKSYRVKSGSLEVKKFDATGIAGTFDLSLEQMGAPDKVVHLTGGFDMPAPKL